MKKYLRTFGAIALAVIMVMAMSIPAFAADADMSGKDGVIGNFTQPDTPTVQGSAVLLYKEITAFNKEASTVKAPTITYNYTIAPGTAGALVKDAGGATLHAGGDPVQVAVKAGLTGATISGSADGTNFTSGKIELTPSITLTTADAGAKNTFKLKADFSGVSWTGAGVYRYVITETTTAAQKNAAGIADGTSTETRYLDVYVKDGATAGTYEVYGYVCFQTLGDIDGTQSASVTKAAKTEGFVADNGGSAGTTALTADQYYTFNVTVSKTLTGDQANKNHQFPFNVDFTNASVTAVIGLDQTTVTGGGITAPLPTPAAVSSLDVTGLKMADGASVKYIGVPVGVTAATTVAVYEKNDVTGTIYKSSYKIDGGTEAGAKSISWETTGDANKSNTATISNITAGADDDVAHTIAFTNALELISPTGLVLRFAPYALMLAAGVVLLLIFRRRREED